MSGNFPELCRGNGARGMRLGKDYLLRAWKEDARNFVHGFVAQRSVNDKNLSAGEVVLPKTGELTGGTRVVRAVQINVRTRMDALQPAGPFCGRDALANRLIGNAEAACLQ